MASIRIMTHNQWKNDHNRPEWEEKGFDCSAKVRTKGFARVYRETLPDIISAQEISPAMMEWLMEYTASDGLNYAILWGRDTSIFYRPDKFEVVDSEFSLYPEEFPGHEGVFNNHKTKSYCIGVFRSKESGRLFIVASTHLWWKSSQDQPYSNEARAYQISLLGDVVERFAKKYGCPSVIVGDLNAGYGSMAIDAIFKKGYRHGHDIATEYADDTNGYHYCYGDGYRGYEPLEFERGIDHILFKGEREGAVLRFDRYYPEYYMPLSDHFPAFVDVEF